ncbi:hypothetical protein [Kiloniella antarctica]|uniref:Outer membrane protein assembly factor BamC n=1 Tax=Kiloniella antarctica TaxID=1550907 RepID=A0ABW5BEX5_9PROT
MNRFEGALRFLQLSALILLLSGCSYLQSAQGIFADKEDVGLKSDTDQPNEAALGSAKYEPETAAELSVPKPKWKPNTIPVEPNRTAERAVDDSEVMSTEGIDQITLVENTDVQQLLGMSFLQVKEKLGQPVWIRDVYPARVWGYDRATCSLQIFFYPKLDQAGDYRVLAYESGLQSEANGVEKKLKNVEKPLGVTSPNTNDDVSSLEQKLIQTCFEELLLGAPSTKDYVPNKVSP